MLRTVEPILISAHDCLAWKVAEVVIERQVLTDGRLSDVETSGLEPRNNVCLRLWARRISLSIHAMREEVMGDQETRSILSDLHQARIADQRSQAIALSILIDCRE